MERLSHAHEHDVVDRPESAVYLEELLQDLFRAQISGYAEPSGHAKAAPHRTSDLRTKAYGPSEHCSGCDITQQYGFDLVFIRESNLELHRPVGTCYRSRHLRPESGCLVRKMPSVFRSVDGRVLVYEAVYVAVPGGCVRRAVNQTEPLLEP